MAELCDLAREGIDEILVEFPEFSEKKLVVKHVGEMWMECPRAYGEDDGTRPRRNEGGGGNDPDLQEEHG